MSARTGPQWIAGGLATLRVPDVTILREPELAPTLAKAAERCQGSSRRRFRVHDDPARTALNRALPVLGDRRIDAIAPQDVADLVAGMHAAGGSRASRSERR